MWGCHLQAWRLQVSREYAPSWSIGYVKQNGATVPQLFNFLSVFRLPKNILYKQRGCMRKLRTQEEIISTWKGDPCKPLVSISCITYNHEIYTEDAFHGFLIQETDFPFEILVHDDASTDRTADIIREYEKKYPKIIKPIYQTENQFSKGHKISFKFNFPRAKGKYIAMCEGDDYWIDRFKLQKQVDFLEKNINYAMCSHGVKYVFDGIIENKNNYSTVPIIDASFEQIIEKGMFIALNSIVFRREHCQGSPDWLRKLPGGHKALILMVTAKGNNHHILDEMAVKRRNPQGVTVTQKKWRSDNYYKYNIVLLENLKGYLENKKDASINKKLKNLFFHQAIIEIKGLNIKNAAVYLTKILKLSLFLK
jgi:glycosyltransferase involved in cell wall biosynthesis